MALGEASFMYERVLRKTFVAACARTHKKLAFYCTGLRVVESRFCCDVCCAQIFCSNIHRHGQLRTMRTRRARDNDEERKISELN